MNDILKDQLVEALLMCATITDQGRRSTLVDELDFKDQITRNQQNKMDVLNIVRACEWYEKGLETLIDKLRFFEKDSLGKDSKGMTQVDAVIEKIRAELAAKDKVNSIAANKKPAYALVIGISKYKNGQKPNQELAPCEFPNLSSPRKDAEDFSDFLKKYEEIAYDVQRLVDEQADLTTIKDELEQLRKRCKQSGVINPAVIVYFSGHGMADEEGRHYLIPYDAERNRLRATAFRNKDLSDFLDELELETNSLVVFLDACHAGAFGAEGVKRAALPQYNFQKDLSEGTSRYIIASCRPGQNSHEWGENSIFTSQLLELLKCEKEYCDEENIDLYNLYTVLKDKVKETAAKHGKDQEPVSEISKRTGIVLAINQQARKRKHQFLDALCKHIKSSDSGRPLIICKKLEQYVKNDKKEEGYDEFYGFFGEYFKGWRPGNTSRIVECSQELINSHESAFNSNRTSKEFYSQEPSKGVDPFGDVAQNKVLDSTARKPSTPVQSQQQERRQLSKEDSDYILSEILGQPVYYNETGKLTNLLKQPVSKEELTIMLNAIASEDDKTLTELLKQIAQRFMDRWPQAKVVEYKTPISLRVA